MTKAKKQAKRRKGQSASKAMLGNELTVQFYADKPPILRMFRGTSHVVDLPCNSTSDAGSLLRKMGYYSPRWKETCWGATARLLPNVPLEGRAKEARSADVASPSRSGC